MKIVLKVRHNGVAKMTGKIFYAFEFSDNRVLVFLHEAMSNQYHRNTDSPGGVDAVVLEYLEAAGVEEYHHFDRTSKTLYIAPIAKIRQFGIWQNSDGRRRCYLPMPFWATGGKAIGLGGLPYVVPWINDEKIVEQRYESAQKKEPDPPRDSERSKRSSTRSVAARRTKRVTKPAQAGLFETETVGAYGRD